MIEAGPEGGADGGDELDKVTILQAYGYAQGPASAHPAGILLMCILLIQLPCTWMPRGALQTAAFYLFLPFPTSSPPKGSLASDHRGQLLSGADCSPHRLISVELSAPLRVGGCGTEGIGSSAL